MLCFFFWNLTRFIIAIGVLVYFMEIHGSKSDPPLPLYLGADILKFFEFYVF